MQWSTLQALFLLPAVFLTVESTRAVFWAARVAHEADRDGPLVRAVFAALISVLAMIPSPVWTVVTYVGCVVWVPVRGVLWLWGIGRGGSKTRSPKAVSEWYAYKRRRRAETLRRQHSGYE